MKSNDNQTPAEPHMQIALDVLDGVFSVCKLAALPKYPIEGDFCFIARTDEELSIVCRTDAVPENAIVRDDGWRALKVRGPLDFALTGIMARISSALADANIPLFAVSTFDTDYILIKAANLNAAIAALHEAGCDV